MTKVLNGAISIILTMLTLLMFTSSFVPSTSIVMPSIVVTLYIVIAAMFKRKGVYIFGGVYITSIIVFFNAFLQDTHHFLNGFAVTLANERFIFLQQFDEVSKLQGGFFVSSIALVLSFLVFNAVQQRKKMIIIGLALTVVMLQIVLSKDVPVGVSICFFVAFLLTLLYMNHSLQHKIGVYVGIVTSLVVIGLPLLLQAVDVTGEIAQQKAQQQITDWRYNSSDSNLPNGQLAMATQLKQNDAKALNVVMEKPVPVYLKGFVGSQFTDYSWSSLNGENYLNNMPLFNALTENGFTSYNQFSLAAATPEEDITSYKMSIQIVSADRRYGYVPYETVTISNNVTALDGKGILAARFLGVSSYDLTYSDTVIQQYPKVANNLYKLQEDGYLNMESYYNEFVYEHYLQMADEDRAVLNNHFTIDEKTISYEQAIERVKDFVQKNLQYTETVDKRSTSLSELLEEKKDGYAPHYATVATLLFRSLQIPARYVEGYIVTNENVESQQAYTELSIAHKNAHAWTEIYIDAVGWIPVEVTPGYEEKMPAVQTEDYPTFEGALSNKQTSQLAAGVTTTQQVKRDDLTDEKTTPKAVIPHYNYAIIALCMLLLVIVLYVLYKKYKRQQYVRVGNNNVKAVRLYSFMLYMLQRELKQTVTNHEWTNDTALQQAFKEATTIYEKAKYSNETVSDDELVAVQQTFATVKRAIRMTKKHITKMPMFWRY